MFNKNNKIFVWLIVIMKSKILIL